MFRVKIFNNDNNLTNCQDFDSLEKANAWVASQEASISPWSYAKEGEYTNLPFGAINYTEEDRVDEMGHTQHIFIVPKQYTVEVKDLTEDYEYKKQLVYASRKKEYGSLESQLDEQFHNYDKWKARIQLIKEKYPLPSQS